MANVKILLVEDENIDAMDIKETLESYNYEVPYVASNGIEAIKQILDIMPDLILIDIVLQGEMNGIDLAFKIKDMGIPFIYITSHSEKSTMDNAMDTEPYGYLIKPFDRNKLKFTIEHALYRKKMEIESSKQISLTQAINRVLKESLISESPQNVSRICLEVLEELTDSTFGFIGEINSAGRIDIITISDPGWAACAMPKSKAMNLIVNMEVRGYWARAIKTGKSVIVNDPLSDPGRLGEPDGHPNITSFMAVPLNHGDEIRGMIALANKKSPYNQDDLHVVETVSVAFLEVLEHKKTQITLQKNEELFRAVAESAVDAIVTTNVQGIIRYFNHSLEDIFGYKKEELIGRPLTTLMPERYHKTYLQELERFKNIGEHRLIGRTVVTTGLKKDTTEFPFEMSLASWKSGKETFFTSIIRDLTEKRDAKEALDESERRMAEIIDFLPDATFAIDDKGIVISWNRAIEEMTGVISEDILGKGNYEYSKPFYEMRRPILVDLANSSNEEINQFYTTFERKSEVLTAEAYVTLQGKNKILSANAVPFYDNKGNFVGGIESIRDITEVKESRRKINWELEINKSLANIYAPLVSPSSTIEDVGRAILNEARKLTGCYYGFASPVNSNSFNITSETLAVMMPDYPEGELPQTLPLLNRKYANIIDQSLDNSKSIFINFDQEPSNIDDTEDNPELTNLLVVPVVLGDDLVGQITLIDAPEDFTNNDLKAIERLAVFYALAIQNKRTEEEIKQSLEDNKILLREVHHRVKNNMQIISSLLNLQINYEDEEPAVNMLKESQGRVKSMSMVHEKLYQSPSFTKIDFKNYVENLVRDIFFSYGITKETVKTEMDIENIEIGIDTAIPCGLIINELVTNSAKYAFPQNKGTLYIKLKSVPDKIELIIADNGIGLPEDLDFKRTDSLGLQLVNNLVKQIDGQISLDRSHGTTFKIIFQELNYEKRI